MLNNSAQEGRCSTKLGGTPGVFDGRGGRPARPSKTPGVPPRHLPLHEELFSHFRASILLALVRLGGASSAPGRGQDRERDPGLPEEVSPGCKGCVAVAGTKKVTKPEYRCNRVDYRLSRLPGLWQLWQGSKSDCLECGQPPCRRALMKRFVTQECPTVH